MGDGFFISDENPLNNTLKFSTCVRSGTRSVVGRAQQVQMSEAKDEVKEDPQGDAQATRDGKRPVRCIWFRVWRRVDHHGPPPARTPHWSAPLRHPTTEAHLLLLPQAATAHYCDPCLFN